MSIEDITKLKEETYIKYLKDKLNLVFDTSSTTVLDNILYNIDDNIKFRKLFFKME